MLGRLGPDLGASGAILGCLGAVFGLSWACLRAVLAQDEIFLAILRSFLVEGEKIGKTRRNALGL